MTTKQFYILLILIADLIAILIDQLVLKKITGFSLSWPYYLYLVLVTFISSLIIYALK